jgi:hypothetical protein
MLESESVGERIKRYYSNLSKRPFQPKMVPLGTNNLEKCYNWPREGFALIMDIRRRLF